jgi:hypothetical protein
MGAARRDLSNGDTVNLRAMISPDPFMGKSGYPELLASGETANGIAPLLDRQHPHDLFMELAASYAHPLDSENSLFLYWAIPANPRLARLLSCIGQAAWIFRTHRSPTIGLIPRTSPSVC